jgi:hypothetical protein
MPHLVINIAIITITVATIVTTSIVAHIDMVVVMMELKNDAISLSGCG